MMFHFMKTEKNKKRTCLFEGKWRKDECYCRRYTFLRLVSGIVVVIDWLVSKSG